jgi:hypothetical protein
MDHREDMNYVELKDCVRGGVYCLVSRNLPLGVFDGVDGFVGVRHKAGDVFLFTEYHWDTEEHRPYGTVRPLELLEMLPEGMEPRQYEPVLCSKHGRPCHYQSGTSTGWVHDDDGSCLLTPDSLDDAPVRRQYQPLFGYLLELREKYPESKKL